MKKTELIPELLLNLFRVLIYWSGYGVILFLFNYTQSLFFRLEMYDAFANISYLLPNLSEALIIAIFILSIQNVRLLKKYR